jgi:Lon protease-like protein
MDSKNNLPNKIPVFPISNFIIFPKAMIPLNIFEPRYIEMIDDSMKNSRMLGMIQPKKISNNSIPQLYKVGCVGKITSFNESEDGTYLIILNGLSRFKILNEIKNNKLYRECNVSFNEFKDDINSNKEEIKFTDLELIFKNLKTLFQKKGYIINWKKLEKQDLNQTINTLAMASPFSLEEKQALLETKNLISRKFKLEEIIKTYILDDFNNTTIQ